MPIRDWGRAPAPRARNRGGPTAHNGGVTRHDGRRGGARLAAATLLALTLAGCSLLDPDTPRRPGTPPRQPPPRATPTPSPSSSAPSAPATPPASGHFSEGALGYFSAIALSSEYGEGGGTVKKWTTDVRIAVHGEPSEQDLATLGDVLADLNALIDPIELAIVSYGANANIYFAPESEFGSIAPEYIPVNMGFFWTWWDGDGTITETRILVSTTDITQTERDHIIREELTQCLGLMNDSYAYEDSVFYQGWTSPTDYAAIDEDLIEMLYLPEITPGMGAESGTFHPARRLERSHA